MQNIQLKNLCGKKITWIGTAVIAITVLADAFCYGVAPRKEVKIDELTLEAEAETEQQTEDVVESLYAGTELDEVHLVMGTIKPNTEVEENTEEVVEEKPQAVIAYTEEDYNNLLRIVEAEATGGDVLSKMMVANVIINRVKHPYFPNTVSEVVFQGKYGKTFSSVFRTES